MIRKEEEKDKLEVREWTEEDNEEMGNMVNLYYELQEIPWDEKT